MSSLLKNHSVVVRRGIHKNHELPGAFFLGGWLTSFFAFHVLSRFVIPSPFHLDGGMLLLLAAAQQRDRGGAGPAAFETA